jgi:hypothetical protein
MNFSSGFSISCDVHKTTFLEWVFGANTTRKDGPLEKFFYLVDH